MSKGYESLVNKVKIDCDEGEGCFNSNGCDQKFRRSIKCSHKYCIYKKITVKIILKGR